ncbi:MAG TPA: queuosine salvage family protein [Solirubrobacteraceae bacterium]|jgi:hypothetical protein|nr:queuosine salvage family protein [Solirubrobacteraceae bacterium]
MIDLPTEIRTACQWVARRARHVSIVTDAIPAYAAALPLDGPRPGDEHEPDDPDYWLTLDAINFGSGWFPTLRKRAGSSGYETIAAGLRERFERHGPWSAAELRAITAAELAATLHQDPEHELIALYARSLNDLGAHLDPDSAALISAAGDSAVALAGQLARWECFGDASAYAGRVVPFYKRAQIAAADLARAGAYRPSDLDRLTMFADNLVPHVLRLDGILEFDPALTARIESEQLIEHGSPEEVEIRACAVHAVELIVAARDRRASVTAAAVDQYLWNKGRQPRYKASPRHRSRCTAY